MGFDMNSLKSSGDVRKALAENKITQEQANGDLMVLLDAKSRTGGVSWLGAVNGECVKLSRFSRAANKREYLTIGVGELIEMGKGIAKLVADKTEVDGEEWNGKTFVACKMVLKTERTPFDKTKFKANGKVESAPTYTAQQTAYVKTLVSKTVAEIVEVLKPLASEKQEMILNHPAMSKKSAAIRSELGVDLANLPF